MQTTEIPVAQSKRKPMPTPMIFILFWFGYSALSTLLTLRAVPMALGPFVMSKQLSALYSLASMIVPIACLVGIIFRGAWARTLSIGWLAFKILVLLVGSGLTVMYLDETVRNLSSVVPQASNAVSAPVLLIGILLGLVFGAGINGAVIYYLHKKTEYFGLPSAISDVESK